MDWSEISILTTNEAVEPVSHILYEAGVSGLVIEDPADFTRKREDRFGEIYELNPNDYPVQGVVIKAYLPKKESLGQTVKTIEEKITNLTEFQIDIGENKVTVTDVKEEDWATAWKKYYHPVKVSDRFTIVPTWEDYTPNDKSELIIELDPGMAFGTGTHPTTVMCIQALEKTVQTGDCVIDVGTGSGVLSIAAAMLGAEKVTALDLDVVAVEAAGQNVSLNRVKETVSVSQNDLLNGIVEPADVVVANILAEVIISFAADAVKAVKPNGHFIASGIIKQKKETVTDALVQAGFSIEETVSMDDWVAIISKRTN